MDGHYLGNGGYPGRSGGGFIQVRGGSNFCLKKNSKSKHSEFTQLISLGVFKGALLFTFMEFTVTKGATIPFDSSLHLQAQQVNWW